MDAILRDCEIYGVDLSGIPESMSGSFDEEYRLRVERALNLKMINFLNMCLRFKEDENWKLRNELSEAKKKINEMEELCQPQQIRTIWPRKKVEVTEIDDDGTEFEVYDWAENVNLITINDNSSGTTEKKVLPENLPVERRKRNAESLIHSEQDGTNENEDTGAALEMPLAQKPLTSPRSQLGTKRDAGCLKRDFTEKTPKNSSWATPPHS